MRNPAFFENLSGICLLIVVITIVGGLIGKGIASLDFSRKPENYIDYQNGESRLFNLLERLVKAEEKEGE